MPNLYVDDVMKEIRENFAPSQGVGPFQNPPGTQLPARTIDPSTRMVLTKPTRLGAGATATPPVGASVMPLTTAVPPGVATPSAVGMAPIWKDIGAGYNVANKIARKGLEGLGLVGSGFLGATNNLLEYTTGARVAPIDTAIENFHNSLTPSDAVSPKPVAKPAAVGVGTGVKPTATPTVMPAAAPLPAEAVGATAAGVGGNTVYAWKDKQGRETLTNLPESIPQGVKRRVVAGARDFGATPEKPITEGVDTAIERIRNDPGSKLRGGGLRASATAQIVELEKAKVAAGGHTATSTATAEDRAARLAETKRYNDIRAADVDAAREQTKLFKEKQADEAFYTKHAITDLNPETNKPEPNDTLTYLRMLGSGEPVPERFKPNVDKARAGFEEYYKRGLKGEPNPRSFGGIGDREQAWRTYWQKFRRFQPEPAK